MERARIKELVALVVGGYGPGLESAHGIGHWCRVITLGNKLCEVTGADGRIVALFGLFHDSRRICEGKDEEHGQRAADFVRGLAETGELWLDGQGLETLLFACAYHTKGLAAPREPNITVKTCWDADRLDLGRLGHAADPSIFYTDAAREMAAGGLFAIRPQCQGARDLVELLEKALWQS